MRVITGIYEGAMHMAIDGYFLSRRENVLRIYSWKPACVSIGYFQDLESTVNVDYCKENDIDIVRRMTGGGVVYHDKELTYSIIVDENLVPADLTESFRYLLNPVIEALNTIGLKAEFEPINDVTVEGKKISGSAQTRKNGRVLQHGTILIDFPSAGMKALKPQTGKTGASKRITTIRNELKTPFDADILQNILIHNFENLIEKGYPENLTESEIKAISKNMKNFLV